MNKRIFYYFSDTIFSQNFQEHIIKKISISFVIFFVIGCTSSVKNNLFIQKDIQKFEVVSEMLKKQVNKCYVKDIASYDSGVKVYLNESKSEDSLKISFYQKGFGYMDSKPFSYIQVDRLEGQNRIIIKDNYYNCIYGFCNDLKLKVSVNQWLNNRMECLNEKSN